MSYQKKCKYFSMEYVGNPGPVPACNRDVVLEVFDCSNCKDNPDNKIPTNADRFRVMTDKELAGYLAPCACPPIRFNKNTGAIVCPVNEEPCESDCLSCWLDWLKQEAIE